MALIDTKVISGEREGKFTSALESQTAKVPSSGYLLGAVGSIVASAAFKMAGKENWALFVGQWAPTFLLLGVYNKIVKQHGSDAFSRAA